MATISFSNKLGTIFNLIRDCGNLDFSVKEIIKIEYQKKKFRITYLVTYVSVANDTNIGISKIKVGKVSKISNYDVSRIVQSMDKYAAIDSGLSRYNIDDITEKILNLGYDDTAEVIKKQYSNIEKYSSLENEDKLIEAVASLNEKCKELYIDNIIDSMKEDNRDKVKMIVLGGLYYNLTRKEEGKYRYGLDTCMEVHPVIAFINNKIELDIDN